MKKISFMLMAFGLVAASCTKSEFDTVYGEDPHADFAQQFTQTFGNIDPNQDWGFGSSLMRGANSTYTKWQSDYEWDNMPENPVSDDEIKFVLKYIADHPDEGGTECDLTDYYMQNIGSSKDSYHLNFLNSDGTTHHSTDIVGGNQMDYLVIDGYHINDYNATTGSFGLAENMPLQDITYHDSYANLTIENAYKFYYIEYNGKVNLYLCFDYRTSKYDNGQLTFDGDGVYNDWVIKLSPADGRVLEKPSEGYKPNPKAVRIIAEDLGDATSDFDYNDVVFDAYIENGRAYITLLAAGGTLPLYVAGEEVHAKFGVSQTTMVNTEAEGGATVDPVSYDVAVSYTEVKDIPITVYASNGTPLELTVTAGGAAEKIAVKTTYQWTTERQHIWEKYDKFNEYVSDRTVEWY